MARYGFQTGLLAALAVAGSLSLAPAAEAATGAWVTGENVRLRLVAAGVDLTGKLAAAIELELAPGWKTYWINPGEAGIPPLADFSGSENVGPVAVSYPVPHRSVEDNIVSNIYKGQVVIPVSAPITDPDAPAVLSLSLDLGVCEVVCIPEKLEADLTVAPGTTDIVAARLLTEAAATIPSEAEPGSFAVDSLELTSDADGVYILEVAVTVPEIEGSDLFVAGPEGWYVGQALPVADETDQRRFRFFVEPYPAGDIGGADFTVLLVAGDKAVHQTIRLDD